MPHPRIIAAGCCIDGQGSTARVVRTAAAITDRGGKLAHLHIAPLSHDWNAPLPPDYFRSGCAPLEALDAAGRLLAAGTADAVMIQGRELLRSEYAGDRALRNRRMAVFGAAHSLPAAYTALAHAFCRNVGLGAGTFRDLAEQLFENHRRAWEHAGHRTEERPEWFSPVTDLFRRADCANPVVDFEGAVLVSTPACAEASAIPPHQRIPVLGIALAQTRGDGPAYVTEIAEYRHLAEAYQAACRQAGVDFGARYRAGEALLEAYTCYPVVPLAFLLASGIARDPAELPNLLARHPVTVTGGMNLARAAWNNPALHGLATLWERLSAGAAPLAALHANGGLGQRQGVALLGTAVES